MCSLATHFLHHQLSWHLRVSHCQQATDEWTTTQWDEDMRFLPSDDISQLRAMLVNLAADPLAQSPSSIA